MRTAGDDRECGTPDLETELLSCLRSEIVRLAEISAAAEAVTVEPAHGSSAERSVCLQRLDQLTQNLTGIAGFLSLLISIRKSGKGIDVETLQGRVLPRDLADRLTPGRGQGPVETGEPDIF